MQENAPEMTLLSGMVRGQADFSQQPYGLTACAGVRHDQYAHSRSCAHCAAHCCQVLQRREESFACYLIEIELQTNYCNIGKDFTITEKAS